ncbi:MAG: universal stress protein [Bacteroidetes bacterium]|nr:universal stress protein [Bacteroidota bacterium]
MKTIIVPTDFSAAAENSAEYAAGLAHFFGARMVLVNACSLMSVSYDVPFSQETISQMYAMSQESLQNLKERLLKKHGTGLAIECVSGIGSEFEIITNTAQTAKADIIVMGVFGEAGPLKERFIGGTALTIARNQTIPTFIIPSEVSYKPIRRISFACDLEQSGQAELLYKAKLFCQVFHANLEIVNVGDLSAVDVSYKMAHHVQQELQFNNLIHSTVYIDGIDAVRELEDYFKNNPTDLIMLSPQKHNPFYYLFNNSVTRSLTFHSKLPILAIH